ncbi:3-ketoacyl-ACP reductase [Bacillus taeanensis]|uniref:3-ketoacyl-ACP reductase n=1 Tax=Bacillus taeanensis TaxID=273032 RepID=A0A366XT65_9BACI|nr:glucose 1-dehydrogenase [Bacillus taeanensis]RBW69087.1 3-ketoacyl-ACP reductase [Bacillus taeanensis]
MTFQHKVVIVTGSANGIGKTAAIEYAKKGAKVVLADMDEEEAQKTLTAIKEHHGEAIFIPTDMRNPKEIETLIFKTKEVYGRIDILINNAGVSRWKSPYELSVEEWDDIININLRGVFLCAREAAKVMRQNQQGGSIVNIASTRALMSEQHTEAYAASKGGIVALTHALAISLSEDQIRVNAISPGWIETGNYEELREIDHKQHPANRVGTPLDIARACFYLTHPENDFVTGENIVIDGGMTRKMMYEH